MIDRARFVLVHPRSPGNVGSAARALKNLGFSRLVVVSPRCDPHDDDARAMAVDAADVLEAMEVHETLDAALTGAGTVIGTSRRRGKDRCPDFRLDQLASRLAGLAEGTEIAFVFGREDRGLSDSELDRCTLLTSFPASDAYPSFNLAQAVLLAAYELRLAGLEPPPSEPLDAPAMQESREAMYAHLQQALRAIGFLQRENDGLVMRRLRRLLGRAAMTADEVRMLRGMARQVLWAAGRAGLTDASQPHREEGAE